MPSTLSSPYAGRPVGWVRTGVRADSVAPQHFGGHRLSTPADATARRRTRQHACTPRDVSARVLYVVDARGSLKWRQGRPPCEAGGYIPRRTRLVRYPHACHTWSNGEAEVSVRRSPRRLGPDRRGDRRTAHGARTSARRRTRQHACTP